MSTPASGKALDTAVSAAAEAPPASTDGDFERLRELLFGHDLRELAAARARIAELEHAQKNLPQRLPDAAVEALRTGKDNARVATALSAPVAQALGSAVQNNRQSIVDALFPVIGPMIRKAIAEALRGLVGNLNDAIESSFTPRGLKWRIEAWRGGVPYAQVVLKHRLACAIDHVFLIERGSGLVLGHASAPGLPSLDADAIAGMLTALGDFVDDSVGGDAGGALGSAQVGEHLVWMEHGPQANLACFMRGVPPSGLRAVMAQHLEDVHARIPALEPGAPLQALGEDADVRGRLDPAALMREAADTAPSAPKASRLPLLGVAVLALALLGAFVAERWRWNARIDALRAQLVAHPGFVLTGIEARPWPWRSLRVRGLLDPDAEPVAPLLAKLDAGGVVPKLELAGYLSADDDVIERRARRLLAPPAGVQLGVRERVLRLDGTAPRDWVDAALARAGWIAGVARVESTLAAPAAAVDMAEVARADLERTLAGLDHIVVPFVQDDQPAEGAGERVDAIAAALRRAGALAQVAGRRLVITAWGSNDDSGRAETNARVRSLRAQWLALALSARGIDGVRSADAAVAAGATADMRGAFVRASADTVAP